VGWVTFLYEMGGVLKLRLRGSVFGVESTVEFPSKRLSSDLPNLTGPWNGLPVDLDPGALKNPLRTSLG